MSTTPKISAFSKARHKRKRFKIHRYERGLTKRLALHRYEIGLTKRLTLRRIATVVIKMLYPKSMKSRKYKYYNLSYKKPLKHFI